MTILPIRPGVTRRLIEMLRMTGADLNAALKPHLTDLYDEDPRSALAGHSINRV